MRKPLEPRSGRASVPDLAARLVLRLVLGLVLGLALSPPAAPAAAAASGEAGPITGHDLKAIHYVENAHGQLEEWTDRLLARLDRGLGAREPEPILDGRAALQTAKIRVTYAGYVDSERLAALFRELSEAHDARLEAVRARLAGADDEAHRALHRELDARVDELITRIRDWRTNP